STTTTCAQPTDRFLTLPIESLVAPRSRILSRCLSGNIHTNNNNMTIYDSLSSTHRRLPHQLTDKSTPLGVAWYACGPTVYDSAHLGHARTYVALDILRRVSLHSHRASGSSAPRPLFVMNVTDVDDKIIERSKQCGLDPLELARRHEDEFWEDLRRLNVLPPDAVCRVSEHVRTTIVPYIRRIVEGGMAYLVPESEGTSHGSVYFDVRALESKSRGRTRYGKLAPDVVAAASADFFSWDSEESRPLEEREDASPSDEKKKRDPRDFCLWKYRPQNNHNSDCDTTAFEPASVSYPSPWGPGRPGWHVECSAMIQRLADDFKATHQFWVHAGGIDLKFPHHSNEIAQAEAFGIAHRYSHEEAKVNAGASDEKASGDANATAEWKEWIPHWIHTGHLYVRGRKMSKSLKNFITIREMLDSSSEMERWDDEWVSPADDFRLWCLGLSGSYRGPATYSPDRLEEARVIREKWMRFLMAGQQYLDRARGGTGDDFTKYPKIWTRQDLELFRTVTQSNMTCQKALVGHLSEDGGKGSFDLDGATFVKEITHIATLGMKYLDQIKAHSDVLAAPEPLMFALSSVRESLALVGFTEKTFNAGLHRNLSQELSGENARQLSTRDRALVDAVVAFRSAVRTAAINGIRNKDGMPAAKDILHLCDELRDEIMPSLGVEILDGKADDREGDTGGWRNCSPREGLPKKRQ
ncbi:hypothetical protein ACHAW6_012825, partial [Cyclotella cf. meneghiniana]